MFSGETARNEITAVSDEARKASASDKSTAAEARARPKRESYVKQLSDARTKGKGEEAKRTPISRYLPRFTIHFASIAFRNNDRTRDLRKCSAPERQDLSDRAELMADELKSRTKEKNKSVRRILERKAKSVDCIPRYGSAADADEGDATFRALEIREDSATNGKEPDNNSPQNAGLLVDFGRYSPDTSREKISKSIDESRNNGTTKSKGTGADGSRSAATSPTNERNPDETAGSRRSDTNNTSSPKSGDFQKNADSKTKNQSVNASKIDKNRALSDSRCKCDRNGRNRIVVYVETPQTKDGESLPPKCKSGAAAVENDFREPTSDRISTAEHAALTAEFSKIRCPKETRRAVAAMISDMKRSQLESGRANEETYTGIGENVRRFKKMCEQYRSEDEGGGKSPTPQSLERSHEQCAGEKEQEGNSARGRTSCVRIRSLYAGDEAKYRSESSPSVGISRRSIFYDGSDKEARRCRSHRRRRHASPPVCRRNSSSFVESRTSLSTDVSYSRVQRLFRSIIADSRTGRLKRFRRNISGYKEMDRLGLGTWRNQQWRPSDSKAYAIYNRFQRNVDGFQGDFNGSRRKAEYV